MSDIGNRKGFDVVLGLLSNHAIKNQPSLIDSAISAGVKHWYPSEFSADLTFGNNWNERYYRDKVLTREYLQKAAEHPEFGYTYFLNGRISEWDPSPHFGIDLTTHTAHVLGRPEMEQSLLGVEDAAKFLVCALLDLLKTQERTFRFVGGNYSWDTIFATLEKIQDVRWTVTWKFVDEARANQKKAIETEDVDGELKASHQVVQGTGSTLLPKPYDNDRFPEVKPLGLETWTAMLENKEKFPVLGF